MLEGLKVVEFATHVAATSAGGFMCEWGAEVTKIEPPGGDPYRYSMAMMGATVQGAADFELHNRGKKSIVLDLKVKESYEVLHDLIRAADVFITNKRPRSLAKLKIDWPNLRAINPRIVYGSLTGYGLRGEEANRAGLDQSAFWARSGLNHLMTVKGEDPVPLRRAIGDRYTGLALFAGIMAALWERQRTGKGRLVEASLLRAGVYAAGTDVANYLRLGRVGSQKSRHENVNPVQNYFRTKDGHWITVQPGGGAKLPAAIGRPELANDPRFATPQARRENGRWLVDTLDQAFAERTREEWAKRLDAADVVWSAVQTIAELTQDPQAIAAGCFVDAPEHDRTKTYRAPALPTGFPSESGGWDMGPRGPAPEVGEHQNEVLHALGYNEERIRGLKSAGTFGSGDRR